MRDAGDCSFTLMSAPIASYPGSPRWRVYSSARRLRPRGHFRTGLQYGSTALAGPFCTSVALFDRYVGKELPEGTHSLAFTLTFRADDRSLQDAEVDAFAAAAVQGAGERFDAQRR